MGRYAVDNGGGDFKQPPAGSHAARAIKIIDIGTHRGEYQGTPTVRNQIIVQWELPNETIEIEGEQKPLVASKFYTNSLSEKANLRKDLESWRARPFTQEELKGFDLMSILGAPAMLSIVHNEKGKAKVVGVSKVPKGMSIPEPFNEPSAFWLDEWDPEAFNDMSQGFKNLIMESDEYQAIKGEPGDAPRRSSAVDTLDDDIPF